MEIIFLIVGLAFLGVGLLIIASEAKDRRDTAPVKGRVIGFSHGRSHNPNLASFHSVAEYVARDGRKYYGFGLLFLGYHFYGKTE
ncbi:MAG TPA: DUF3592 domain-containing protein, partial [Terriglobia bacterium]|nr:DUF3592 domain-containing protein [Terriglobia bacterium]